MKRFYSFIYSLMTIILFTIWLAIPACSEGESPVTPDNPSGGTTEFSMTVTPDTIKRPADTISVSYFHVQLSEPSSFYAKAEKDWVLLSNAEGNGASSYKVAVRTVSNRTPEPRFSKVSFYSGTVTRHAYVWQQGEKQEQITVTPDTLYINAEKGSQGTVTFNPVEDSEYTIEKNSWFSQEEKRDGKTLRITYTARGEWNEEYRTKITLIQKGKKASFVLVQRAKQSSSDDTQTYDIKITPDKHDKNASPERIFSMISIDKETTVTVTSDAEWCVPHNANFDKPSKDFKLYMDVSANTGKDTRTATVTVKAGNSSETCIVTQEGGYKEKLEIGGTVGDAVDLGLSVKWSSHNLGASKAEESGVHLAWGELKPKKLYKAKTYKYYNSTYAIYIDIGNNICGTKYDAASVYWGNGWRMPDKKELLELKEKCKWTWTRVNSINGYKVTGPNGNSIFIPAAGEAQVETPTYKNERFMLWSGNLSEITNSNAWHISGASYYLNSGGSLRCKGNSIRPVKDKD